MKVETTIRVIISVIIAEEGLRVQNVQRKLCS